MDWKKPWDFPLPNPNDSMADFMLAYDVRVDIVGFADKFLAKNPDPQYADPEAYLESLASRAFDIKNTPYTAKYAPAGWSPIKASFAVWNKAVDFMKTVAVNAGDEKTNNVYDAWVAKTGYLYGGHPLIPAAPAGGANSGVSTGAPKPGGGPVTIFGQPVK